MATRQPPRNLQEIVESVPNLTDYLYNNQTGRRTFPVVPPEFTTWQDEQRAWRETVCLYDLSYHMSDLYVYGPDAFKLLNYLGINSFKNFEPGQAKQYIACTDRGYLIGDGILFYLEKETFQLVGRPSVHNWVQFHAETGGYNVRVERDEWSVADPNRPRKVYRFQLQGPNAPALLEKLTGQPLPPLKFFHMTWLTIAGRKVRFLHHGMAGVAGGELIGPFEEGPEVKAAIVEAGKEFGLRQVGSRAYPSNALESGWIPNPLPAIYTGESLRAYRQWLPATSYEAVGSLGGSFYSPNIEDYYLTPWDLGYGHILKLDHDFIGREALEAKAKEPHRRKVTLVWNPEDLTRAFESYFTKPLGQRAKFIDLPVAQYATWFYDKVVNRRGDVIGFAMWPGYTSNETAMVSLATVDEAYSQPGTEAILVWGEPNGGSRKPSVEPHVQMELRVTVAPAPFAESVRQYRAAVAHR